MLEKIGLPPKPSLRGNNWVVDSTHCQGCSSQFTFINRKHHCRRCGGLFCNSCTQLRMVLRGQGDSPVRICEPCKKLEEAARFEMRHGQKSRARRGSSRLTPKDEDDVLNQILGNDGKETSSSRSLSNIDVDSVIQRTTSSASCSNTQEAATHDEGGGVRRSHSVDERNHIQNEIVSTSPEELRQRALEEKKKYKILKGEGKSEEALRAFKRGRELERQADALELSIRKNRKKVLSSGNMPEIQTKDGAKESSQKSKMLPAKGKDDLTAELRELGWSDLDFRDEDKKSASVSLEGELSSLLGDISKKANKDTSIRGIDKTQVVAHKKKALMLKREGKIAEAKEELKRAKVLEKQLEEQELLAEAEDSDDEISALIHGMDNDGQDDVLIQYEQEHGVNLDHLMVAADDAGVDNNFEVTDEDMEDPEIASALKSLGWADDSNNPENIVTQTIPVDREALLSEILSLKREALNKKRAGNVAEAMAQLKKAKLLERDLGGFESQVDNFSVHNPETLLKISTSQTADKSLKSVKVDDVGSKFAPKSKLMIQKELLGLKKKALALRREGKLDEAEEELKKGRALEQQLEEMDSTSKVNTTQVTIASKELGLAYDHTDIPRNPTVGEEGEDNVTDQDLHDPAYLSFLRNLGWNDEDNELASSQQKPFKQNDSSVQISQSSVTQVALNIPVGVSRRPKTEIQRELLGLKRKALALRREGKTEEAEEVLIMAKPLEAQIAEMEAPKKDVPSESNRSKEKIIEPPLKSAEEGDEVDVTETDIHDPALLSVLNSLGWKDEEVEPVTVHEKPSKQVADNSVHSSGSLVIQSSSNISVAVPRSKGEIQRELLGLKRRALALRRKGETEEAEEVLKMAKVLEAQMEELEAPKKELLFGASKDEKSGSFESLINHATHENLKDASGVNKGSTPGVVDTCDEKIDSSIGLGSMESDTYKPSLRLPDFSIPVTSQLIEDNHPLLGELGPSGEMGLWGNVRTTESTSFIPPPSQSVNIMDLLTGNDWRSSQIPTENLEDRENIGSDISSPARPHSQLGSLSGPHEDLISKDNVTTGTREEMVCVDKKPHTNSIQGFASQNNQDSLKQEILAHKRKAVALKREGKLTEARDELRQAKLLEKSLEEDNPQPKAGPHDVSKPLSNVPSVVQNEHKPSNLVTKPLSGRDRFKLQQESLSHKRQALKLRREGRMEEAEAEFELAKALETQLDELTAHDSSQSSVKGAELVDDVAVEDLLDPQLLSALRAIGLEDTSIVSQRPERPEPVKPNASKSENFSQERIQLEERIRAEKVKAVNLKRSGKQAEALEALRRAKQFEKKLNSLSSN